MPLVRGRSNASLKRTFDHGALDAMCGGKCEDARWLIAGRGPTRYSRVRSRSGECEVMEEARGIQAIGDEELRSVRGGGIIGRLKWVAKWVAKKVVKRIRN